MSGIIAQAWQGRTGTHLNGHDRRSPTETSPRSHRGMALAAVCAVVLLAITAAVTSNGAGSLLSLGGLIIVFGGVTASAFMTFPSDDVRTAMAGIATMLNGRPAPAGMNLCQDMQDIAAWSRIAYGQGLRALEHGTARKGAHDPFVSYGLNLVVSDYAPEDIRAMLEIAADGNYEREHAPVDVLSAMASHAPAFGMVGTLIGMISMLHDMGSEPGAIGSMLAVAFLSTLYGVLSARMIYMPAASRLERQVEARRLRDSMVTEGMVMLAGRKPPTVICDRLNAFLHPNARTYFNIIDGVLDSGPNATLRRAAASRAIPRRILEVVKG
jgi:chemotaxis protein MotA